MEQVSIDKLIEQIGRGDETALAEFYDLTRRRTYGLALRILKDAGAAEEVTLDVYLQVWRSAEKFDTARGQALTWLLMQTRTRAIDRLRKLGTRRTETTLDDASSLASPQARPDESLELTERSSSLLRAMAALVPEQREALGAAFFRGLSHSAIAKHLGLPLGTVKTRIRTGLAKLRHSLENSARSAS